MESTTDKEIEKLALESNSKKPRKEVATQTHTISFYTDGFKDGYRTAESKVTVDLVGLWKYVEAMRNIIVKAHEEVEPGNMSHISRGYLSQHSGSLVDVMDELNNLIEKYNPNGTQQVKV